MSVKKKSAEEFTIRPFKDLKKILESREKNVPAKPVESSKRISANDDELFANAMKGVREIREFRDMPVNRRKPPVPCKNSYADKEVLNILEDIVKGERPINLSDTPEYVKWVNEDYREYIIDQLHHGLYSVQDCLDLHGTFVDEAEAEVELFINESMKKGHQCIKIIHGRGLRSRGGPVLKEAVIKLLLSRFRKYMIAFVTARQCDGGLGALYVLLKQGATKV